MDCVRIHTADLPSSLVPLLLMAMVRPTCIIMILRFTTMLMVTITIMVVRVTILIRPVLVLLVGDLLGLGWNYDLVAFAGPPKMTFDRHPFEHASRR